MKNRGLWAAAVAIVVIASVALLKFLETNKTLRGSVIDPPMAAPQIELAGSDGTVFRLSDQRGNVTMIFFGYTNCPDECPLAMANLRTALELLGQDGARTRVAMVTTDPARDTPEALRAFLARFNSDFIGLTGSHEELSRVWKAYGVTVMDDGETHSNYIYVIDQDGLLVETALADTIAADLASDVWILLSRD
jgi:protein SCO1/2